MERNSSNIINPKIQIYLWIAKKKFIFREKKKLCCSCGSFKKEKGVENAMEILEEGELKEVYKKRLKEELKISNKMLNKIYDELKLKIIG